MLEVFPLPSLYGLKVITPYCVLHELLMSDVARKLPHFNYLILRRSGQTLRTSAHFDILMHNLLAFFLLVSSPYAISMWICSCNKKIFENFPVLLFALRPSV